MGHQINVIIVAIQTTKLYMNGIDWSKYLSRKKVNKQASKNKS